MGEVNVTTHRIISLLCVHVPACLCDVFGGMCADVWVEAEDSLGCSQSCPPCLFYFISFCGICRFIYLFEDRVWSSPLGWAVWLVSHRDLPVYTPKLWDYKHGPQHHAYGF